MKRFTGLLNRRGSQDDVGPQVDSPEANVARAVRLFCESGGPNNQGEEVLYLPTIVDGAESTPAAAREAASVIRKFLTKECYNRPHVQYNAIMLMRILADHPGKIFTQNLDQKFVNTVKELIRFGKDLSVQQILKETLDTFQRQKYADETLLPLRLMWEKETKKIVNAVQGQGVTVWGQPVPRTLNAPPFNPNQPDANSQNYFARNHRKRGLPPPEELAGRVEEARTSAKLLVQVVQSTPTSEILNNDLIKEFAERCQSASHSVQGYINSENPVPDDDTLLFLIETNEQLSMAMSKHQRALLQARRAAGIRTPSVSPQPGLQSAPTPKSIDQVGPPPGPPPRRSEQLEPPSGLAPRTYEQVGPPPGPPLRKIQLSDPPARSRPNDMDSVSSSSGMSQDRAEPIRAPSERSLTPQAVDHLGPPSGPPPQRKSLDEDPFGDENKVHLQETLEPQNFGGPQPHSAEPFHPGYNGTSSYVQRQYTAMDGTVMHGAGIEEDEDQDQEASSVSRTSGRSMDEDVRVSRMSGLYLGADGPVSPVPSSPASHVETRQPVTYRY
ncbi:MAG: hypothetical protein M1827_003411 [Pycnora praestabilis]|nr:MAG: hypothetical protein M1827_003411 [Pycnora praestabilis]